MSPRLEPSGRVFTVIMKNAWSVCRTGALQSVVKALKLNPHDISLTEALRVSALVICFSAFVAISVLGASETK